MSRCPRDRCDHVTVSRTCSSPSTSPAHRSLVRNIVTALSMAMMYPSRGDPFKIKYYFDTGMTQYCIVTTVSVSYCHDRSCCQTNISVDFPRLQMSGHTAGDKMQPQHFLSVCTHLVHSTYNTTTLHTLQIGSEDLSEGSSGGGVLDWCLSSFQCFRTWGLSFQSTRALVLVIRIYGRWRRGGEVMLAVCQHVDTVIELTTKYRVTKLSY